MIINKVNHHKQRLPAKGADQERQSEWREIKKLKLKKEGEEGALKYNNNNGYLERLTRTGPKRLHVLYKYILSKFNAYNMNAHTNAHTRTKAELKMTLVLYTLTSVRLFQNNFPFSCSLKKCGVFFQQFLVNVFPTLSVVLWKIFNLSVFKCATSHVNNIVIFYS